MIYRLRLVFKKNKKKTVTRIMYPSVYKGGHNNVVPFYTDNLWYWLEDPCQLNEKIGWEIALKASPSLTIENKISIYQNIKEERLMDVAKDIFRSKNASVVIAGMIGKLTQKEIKSIVKSLDD